MSSEILKYAFVAGELSPTLFGRTDLEKYDLGLALAKNWFVDYKGGISTRAGTRFVDYIWKDDKKLKMFPFQFEGDIADTYIVLFGHFYVRFIQNGAYVEEDAKLVEECTVNRPARIRITGHGFQDGDWVRMLQMTGMSQLNGRIGVVTGATANRFFIHDEYGEPISTFGSGPLDISGGGPRVRRIHTVETPYSQFDLEKLRAYQIRDTVRLTHPLHKIRNLVRFGTANWELQLEEFEVPPVVKSVVVTASKNADPMADPEEFPIAVGAAVTGIVVESGRESQRSKMGVKTGAIDYTTQAGHIKITWSPPVETLDPDYVSPIEYYRVYRTRIVRDGDFISGGEELGFIGQTHSTTFIDSNIVPDFATTPPQGYNPFADGRVTDIRVTKGGTGYGVGSSVQIDDPTGHGFLGHTVIGADDEIVAIFITNGGEGYTDPVLTVAQGSGAEFDVKVAPLTGNYPSVSAVFQQRQIYASNLNDPALIWGSRPGEFGNFDISRILTAGDSYEFELDMEVVGPLHHIIPLRTGLLLLGDSGIWNLTGGQEVAVTPLNVVAERQSYAGAARTEPVTVDSDVLYLEKGGRKARLLRYNEIGKVYSGMDISVLSNHFFSVENQVIRWAFARSPANLIWAVREDGTLLSFTVDIEQNVFAWTQHETKGLVEDVAVVEEFGHDVVYFIVQRYVNGRWSRFVERMADRNFNDIEEAWCVDSGLQSFRRAPDAELVPKKATGPNVQFETRPGVFKMSDVGQILRGGGGKARIIEFIGSKFVKCEILREFTAVVPQSTVPFPIPSGEWTMAGETGSVGGLRHLEGELVQVFVDGNVLEPQTVVDGSISLGGIQGSYITVGLGFQAVAQTLPPSVTDVPIEARRKDIVGSAVRVYDTRGLKVGATMETLYEMKDRTTEAYGDPTRLQRKSEYVTIAAEWNVNGQTLYVQDYPLPATVLGLVLDLEIGDDPR